MKRRIKKILQRATSMLLEPTLKKWWAENQSVSDRKIQILLSLKYREIARNLNESLGFEEVGFNVCSSNYEDGILLYIFSIIGMTDKKCVDIGSGTIKGSNVANLIINHSFKGLLIDSDPKSIKIAEEYYSNHPETSLFLPTLVASTATAENINTILVENKYVGEVDLMCIDIDGVDYWIWKAIEVIQPRVVVVEYQDILGPERSWTVPYKGDFNVHDYGVNKQHNNYCGASLSAFVNLGKQKGYRLVGCNKGGWNAFFVKIGLADKYLPEVTVGSCFKYEFNQFGIEKRFPLVKDMEWVEV